MLAPAQHQEPPAAVAQPTGSSWWMGSAHILTVFLGPGILSMPYIMSRLGWVASLTALLLFFCVTLWTSGLLAEVYEVRCVSLVPDTMAGLA